MCIGVPNCTANLSIHNIQNIEVLGGIRDLEKFMMKPSVFAFNVSDAVLPLCD